MDERLASPSPQARAILAERDGELPGLAHTILGHDASWGAFPGNLHVTDVLKLGLPPHYVMQGIRQWAETHMDEVLANREEDDAASP